jgi:cytochrome c oxidase assembly protein subunit 11
MMAQRRNIAVAVAAGGLALLMIGAAFAAVPLYFAFCRATGFAGTTQVASHALGARGQRTLKVRFVANVAPGLDWTVEPETDAVEARTGETKTVFFRFHNRADHDEIAHAVYNVTPEVSGAWFDKIACFCFTDQTMKAHETVELPVVFFLDPKLEGDRDMDVVSEITLSYSLFALPGTGNPVALAPREATPKL